MNIDISSIMFNMDLPVGGQPAWGTSLGQSEGHKFTYPGYENILVGLVYNKISDIENIFCPLGRGGNKQSEYEMILAGQFNKIFANGVYIPDASFIMLLVKQLVAGPSAQQHIGRRILKYNNGITYKSEPINDQCYKSIATTLGMSDNAAWFVSNVEVKNQDELHFKVHIADRNNKILFSNSDERKAFCQKLAGFKRQLGGTNIIYYGAPGCGKSFRVNKALNDSHVLSENRVRVTFHPDFSNSDFIGQILPYVETRIDENGKPKDYVEYKFNPGPFTIALKRAYETNDMVYLILEELNRGNASAIFGDLFQLLDRVKDINENNYGESEYPICNPNVQKYLNDELRKSGIINEDITELKIPSNLSIIGTMNSSDQNVFTLDTAFKRRWEFIQVGNDIEKDEQHNYKKWFIPGTNVTWEKFLTIINNNILEYKIHNQTNEDKRLGKYFVARECLTEKVEDIANAAEAARKFAYKVFEYLWNDVCKIGREDWFDISLYKTLEVLIESFVHPQEGNTPLSVFKNIKFE